MEILLLIIIAILVFIAYKLIKVEKAMQMKSDNPRLSSTLSTSLNPLFSEEEIASQKNLSEKWQAKVQLYFNLLRRTEKEEVEKHHASGKEKTEFKPSARLKDILLQEAVALVGRNTTEVRTNQMIEANISIINGKSIAEVSEQFYKQKSKIPWENTDLTAYAWQNESEIKNMFEENLKQRSEFWLNSWHYILEKDYLTKK